MSMVAAAGALRLLRDDLPLGIGRPLGADADGSRLEVHVAPAQTRELSASQAAQESEQPGGVQPVLRGDRQEARDVLPAPDLQLGLGGLGQRHVLGGVPRKHAVPDCVGEGLVQDAVGRADGRR